MDSVTGIDCNLPLNSSNNLTTQPWRSTARPTIQEFQYLKHVVTLIPSANGTEQYN